MDLRDYDYGDEFDFDPDEHCSDTRGVWFTRDGKKIPFKQMSSAHLINTIRFIERNSIDYKESRVYKALKREKRRRQKNILLEVTESQWPQ